jgi:hypothetical protein
LNSDAILNSDAVLIFQAWQQFLLPMNEVNMKY